MIICISLDGIVSFVCIVIHMLFTFSRLFFHLIWYCRSSCERFSLPSMTRFPIFTF